MLKDAPLDPSSIDQTKETLREQCSTPNHRSALVFPFLRQDLPPPSKLHMHLMVGCLCFLMILIGWTAGAIGPLLPYLQDYYHVSYLIISIIFVTNFIGGLIAGVSNIYLSDRLGFGLCAIVGAFGQALGYAFMCWGGPYPLFAIMYGVVGFGFNLTDAQVNGLSSRLPNAKRDTFIIQACFGLGALIAPLISTAFVKVVPKAYTYFAVSLGLSVFTTVLAFVTFRGRTTDQILKKRDFDSPPDETQVAEPPRVASTSGQKLRRMIALPRTWVLLFWNLFYVGVEVAVGSWATSYLIVEKGGNESAGYVTTGYYAGLTLGRILLMPVCDLLGNQMAIQVFTLASLVFQILSWVIPSLIASAVFFSLVGLAFGSIFPAMLMVVVELFDTELQEGVMGFLGAMGGAGAAIVPFAVGALSNTYGIWSMQPFCIALMISCLVLWSFIPTRKPIWKTLVRRLRSRR